VRAEGAWSARQPVLGFVGPGGADWPALSTTGGRERLSVGAGMRLCGALGMPELEPSRPREPSPGHQVPDVLDLERGEEGLRRSEARWRSLVLATAQIVWTTPADGLAEDMPLWRAFTGQSEEQVRGEGWLDALHPDDRQEARRLWSAAVRKRRPHEGAYRVRRRDGAWRHLRVRAVPVPDERGEVLQWVGLHTDVTEQVVAEARLQTQHACAIAIAESATVAEAAQRILRATCETLGWDLGAMWAVDRQAQVLRCIALWREPAREAPDFEAVSRHRSFARGVGLPGRVWEEGRPVWLRDVGEEENFPRAPVAAREGLRAAFGVPVWLGREVQGVLEFFSGEVREPDAESLAIMAAVGSQLGQFVERKRSEEALQAANARLQDLDQMKTQFLNNVSHELRTPLTSIALQLEMLSSRGPLTERQRASLQLVERNLTRLSALVRDVLDVARMQGHGLHLEKVPLDLAEALALSAESFQEIARRARIGLEWRVEGDLRLAADPQRIGQVLDNLFGNAVKFTDAGGSVLAEARREGAEVVVRMRDTGVGLAPGQVARLFEPFGQVHDTSRRTSAGTGLGLYISKGIVERHGGRMWCESAGPGRGATFCFTLPAPGTP
jgi:PAS domain S-box-containing protein